MKTNGIIYFSRTQRGVSLIELMVTMTIGLVILVALGYFFLGSQQISRTTDDVSRMQESGRNAIELIGRALRQAGARSEYSVMNGKPLKNATGVTVSGLSGTNGTGTASDNITAVYESQSGGEINCVSTALGSAAKTELVSQVFAVNANRQLTCNGTAVVDNVEDMQVQYGIDATRDGTIDSAYIDSPTATQFNQVAAVRVTLLVRSPSAKVTSGSQTYTYNGTTVTSNDGFLRQVYNATYTVRNQAW